MSTEMKSLRVEQFIAARSTIAAHLGKDSQSQRTTRERQAESLMALGFIDFDAVLATLDQPKASTEDGTEQA
ncbi:MAG: hypothetical protein J7474_04560 [Arthrobacter sp.]|nr:hypothetical protein [Arthrobacter sp.]